MKKQMTEEERRHKRKGLMFAMITAFIIMMMIIISFAAGYFLGVKITIKYFTETMVLLIKSSDIKITANLSINETKMIDYMFEKMGGIDNSTIQRKEFIPPCNPDPSIPKGETSRCIEEQVIDKPIDIPGTIYYCEHPTYKDGYYYCNSDDINNYTYAWKK